MWWETWSGDLPPVQGVGVSGVRAGKFADFRIGLTKKFAVSPFFEG